jgi:hypothetical protein
VRTDDVAGGASIRLPLRTLTVVDPSTGPLDLCGSGERGIAQAWERAITTPLRHGAAVENGSMGCLPGVLTRETVAADPDDVSRWTVRRLSVSTMSLATRVPLRCRAATGSSDIEPQLRVASRAGRSRGRGGFRTPLSRQPRVPSRDPTGFPDRIPTDSAAGNPMFIWLSWSGWGDSNSRPPAPKAGALPGCATSRRPDRIRLQSRRDGPFRPCGLPGKCDGGCWGIVCSRRHIACGGHYGRSR